MSSRKFKFVSPGIYINEIDKSQLPSLPGQMGPAIIGRTRKGPCLRPTKINSFSDYVDTFGDPVAGGGGGDVFRDGDFSAPTYAAYAAQAWLRNNSPVTVVRLLGKEHTNRNATTGRAGWKTEIPAGTLSSANTAPASNGGAFGLFVTEQETFNLVQTEAGAGFIAQTGTLAAIWYLNTGSIELSGNNLQDVSATGSAYMIKSVATNNEFKAIIRDGSGTEIMNTSFNFTPTSPNFIRKVFNTNPVRTNLDITAASAVTSYWLGETYEGNLKTYSSGSVKEKQVGFIHPLQTATIIGGDFQLSTQPAKTGWFFSQDVTNDSGSYFADNQQKLFRVVCQETGEYSQRNYKISLKNIKRSTDPFNKYGTFSLLVRDLTDTDAAPKIVEQYNNVNLNPFSDNYIAKKIGDSYSSWSDTDRAYKYYGNYSNNSTLVRVQMNEDLDAGTTNPEFLPYGVFGPPRFKTFVVSGSGFAAKDPSGITSNLSNPWTRQALFARSIATAPSAGSTLFISASVSANADADKGSHNKLIAALKYPALRLRVSSSLPNENVDLADPSDLYWCADTTYNSSRFDESVKDVLRARPNGIGSYETDTYSEYSWIFTLDDIRNNDQMVREVPASTVPVASSSIHVWESGSYAAGRSYTSTTGTFSTASYTNVLDKGIDRFTTCLHGGFDGTDITERDPFRNTLLSSKSNITSAPYNTVKVAIDSLRDAEVVEYDLAVMPGITNSTLNAALIDVCDSRGDALAIVDLAGGFVPDTENTQSIADRLGTVDTTVSNLRSYGWNSSYGAAYYPWVQIRDNINGATLWAPPSIAALGAMSFGQASSELWFAPAGFTRGGLSQGAGGVPVVGVRQKLTSKERDKLYDANINPIASFPAEGIVIFGQKTLQVTPSALDRINVRRLLIFLKKEISRMAATVLFDQNVRTTWNRFRGQVEPFLDSVRIRLGVEDYRLILDETTTTPDLIDRNIMYAKIFIKPARAIEFIALDFTITDSGASFED